MRIRPILAWSLAGLLFGGSVAYGQSLVDLSRKEEERRKAVKAPSKVYTIQDVQKASGVDPTVPQPAAAGVIPAAGVAGAKPAEAGAAPKDAAAPPAEQGVKDEAYWRGMLSDARTKLERSNAFLSALKTQYEVLANRFTTLSDAAQRGAVVAEMEKVQAELDRVQQDVGQSSKDLADLEEQARRAGVPAAWIRPPDR
jgi:hypothetical protein